jgi:16S rRNA processing protein RimM
MTARPRSRRRLPSPLPSSANAAAPGQECSARQDDAGQPRVCVGVVTAPHGVRGAVRLKSFTAIPENVARYGPVEDESGRRRYQLQLVGSAKGVLLTRLSGVEDRNQAEGLRGLRLYLPRAALPPTEPDEYYHADLIGLRAALADGTAIGAVRAVHDFGTGDTLEIDRRDGPPVMVPFTRAIVPVVDLAAGRLVLAPPPGLLDDKRVGSSVRVPEPSVSSCPDLTQASPDVGEASPELMDGRVERGDDEVQGAKA